MVVKTYRGLLADGGQDRIRLQTIRGKVGYKIIKLQVMPNNLNSSGEACIKIFKNEQSSATFEFDFSDSDLLAAAYYTVNISADAYSEDHHVIFDNEIVNQDIYITHQNKENVAMNYYLELEVIPLASAEAAITTVKAMRGTAVD